jgi:acetyl-CoA synthetase
MAGASTITKEELQNHHLPSDKAEKIRSILEATPDQKTTWLRLTHEALEPDMPASLHQLLFQRVYEQDDQYSDAPIAWEPDDSTIRNANITALQSSLNLPDYQSFHHWSVTNRDAFWQVMIERLNIPFHQAYQHIVNFKGGLDNPEWLPGAKLNIAEACFQADPDSLAITYGKEDGTIGNWTYKELGEKVSQVANGLRARGFGRGHKAVICMPMTAEAVAIYLGIIWVGGIVVSIADSLAPNEIEKRSSIAESDLFFTQDVVPRSGKTIPLYPNLRELKHLPPTIVLPGENETAETLRSQDQRWETFLGERKATSPADMNPEDHCNILFSSGTTSDPKAIPWTHATPIKCATDGHLHQDIHQGEVVAWPTNIGWMMGPWLIFAALMNKATIALYYGAPTDSRFGAFVEKAGINMLGLVPSMVKRWLETDCMKGLDWSAIRVYSSTGESSNPQDYLWLMAKAGYKPVIEYCGGTEIGGGYFTGTVVQPASPATFSTPALGLDLVVLDEDERPSEKGEVFLIPPSIGLSNTLLNKDHYKTYYQGTPVCDPSMPGTLGTPIGDQTASLGYAPILRRHGDEVRHVKGSFYRAEGRADDTMNIGGIKVSAVEIERLLDLSEGVKETAAIAVPPKGGGPSNLVIYAVPQQETTVEPETLKKHFQDSIKKHLSPLFKISRVEITDQLPRTASNKIMRRVLRERFQAEASS